jgi:membrane protease YdiL (CAAX protease family)
MDPLQSNIPDLPPDGAPEAPGPPTVFQRIHPVVYALLSLVVVFFLYQVVAGALALVVTGGRVTEDTLGVVRWLTLIGQVVFILVPTIILTRLRHRRLREFFRVHVPDYREIIATIVAVFALQQMLVGYMALQDMIPLPTELQRLIDVVKKLYEETYRLLVSAHSPFEFLWVVIVVALVPSIVEELLFRGLVQRNLEEAAGGMRGAVLAGLIFGAYHLIPTSLIPLAVLGTYFGFIVVRTQNITVAMSAHFFNNFVACAAMYLNLDDDFVAVAPTGGATGGTMVVNFAVFSLVFVAATLYLITITQFRHTD